MQTVSEDGSDRDRVQPLRINPKIDLDEKKIDECRFRLRP